MVHDLEGAMGGSVGVADVVLFAVIPLDCDVIRGIYQRDDPGTVFGWIGVLGGDSLSFDEVGCHCQSPQSSIHSV
jgi:hypothetical protein